MTTNFQKIKFWAKTNAIGKPVEFFNGELKQGDPVEALGHPRRLKFSFIKLLVSFFPINPLDPVINEHYADTLWMLNKNIQARYFWNHIMKLDSTEQKLKDLISKKLIFGINRKL